MAANLQVGLPFAAILWSALRQSRLKTLMTTTQTLFDNTPVLPSLTLAEAGLAEERLSASAQVVIVGGGIAGAAIAYHFGLAGWKDVWLLDQHRIGSGTTWHSAGQVGQLRSSSAQTQVNKYSAELYAQLAADTGHDPGWLQCGGLQLATCPERMLQLKRNADMARVFGVEAEVISAERCREHWPMLNTDDIVGGVYLPGDGRVLPGECTLALVKGARQRGVRVVENVQVNNLLCDESRHGLRRFHTVETNHGSIQAQWIVLAGNMWMRQLGLQVGVDIPVYPCEHHYLITKPMEGVTRNAPCTRDPDAGLYFRALDDGGLKLGAFKKRSKPWQIQDRVPDGFEFALLDPDWPDFAEPLAAHMHRLRGLSRDDVVKFVNGPEAFTPDNNFVLGQPHLTEGLFVAGGWNSAGIACAGGAGKYAVEWIENGGMTIDLSSVDIRRFLPSQNDRGYLQQRVSEVLGLHYQMAWPGRQMETARDVRIPALYDVHRANNACFGATAGWERPLFFAAPGESPAIEYSFVRQNWHDRICDEVLCCRENVAVLDQSTFAKFHLQGPDACRALQYLCGNNVDTTEKKAVYTGLFNEKGTYESDLTVVRLAEDRFYIVTATGQQSTDFDWIARHLVRGSYDCQLTDVTDGYSVVSVMGPNSQTVLRKLDAGAFEQQSPAYGSAMEFIAADAKVLALRVSYVGEPGWELHVPTEHAVELYRMVEEAGADFGIRPAGNLAISAMRIEKGFRAIGHELSVDETPLEAGLGWAIDWSKEFLGKQRLVAQKSEGVRGLRKRLVQFQLEDPSVTLWGSEPLLWDGEPVGYATSACYGPTVGRSVGMGYVRNPHGGSLRRSDIESAQFEILVAGTATKILVKV